MENELELKWRRIQQAMRQEEADGCLLTMNMNLYYVSGQVFNGYFYLPAEGRPYWFVKRLTIPETNQVHVIRKPEQIPDFFRDLNLAMPRKLLLEADELSYNEYIRLQHVFRAEATGNASALIRHIRMIKTPWEIEQMRISARKHEAVYREIPACYRPGMRDIELQIEIEKRMRVHGSLGYFRAFGSNMDIFMGSILAGENAEVPSPFDFALGGSGIDASCPLGANGTPLKEGTAIMVDMAGNYTAFGGDRNIVISRAFEDGGYVGKLYCLSNGYDPGVFNREITGPGLPGASCRFGNTGSHGTNGKTRGALCRIVSGCFGNGRTRRVGGLFYGYPFSGKIRRTWRWIGNK